MGLTGNFTRATADSEVVTLRGESRAPSETIVDLRVGLELVDGESSRVEFVPVAMVGETWVATVPVRASPPDAGPDFEPGRQVLAFGVETRRSPLRTDTWAQMLTIDAER
jgi:hypothetical protein